MTMFDFSHTDIMPSVTKEWLLSRVSEKEIMDFYLGQTHSYGSMFCSPFRRDRNPSCTLFISNRGRPMYRDWTESRPVDCFEVAQEATGIWNFPQLLARIASDLRVDNRREKSQEELALHHAKMQADAKTQKANIRVRVQPFREEDLAYLRRFHLDNASILSLFNVYSPDCVWLHGEMHYVWNRRDPALAYYFGKADDGSERWKIYFYRRREFRFLGNTSRIQGWIQLPERHNVVVLTKSLKDVMCLRLFDVPAIAMQGEMTLPYPRIVKELRERFANIYTLYDFDRAGVMAANKLRKSFGIEPLFLTNGKCGSPDFGAKDFSDYLRDFGVDKTRELLRQAVRHTGVKLTTPYESNEPFAPPHH